MLRIDPASQPCRMNPAAATPTQARQKAAASGWKVIA
jgi:hypothetical protein